MAQINDTQLLAFIAQYLPDNNDQLIDPIELRYVLAQLVAAKVNTEVLLEFAQLASPRFTGTPQVPTAPAGTDSDQVASTAFVQAALLAIASGKNLSELVLPQDVQGGFWYLTGNGFWEARRSFSAVADPVNGPNWRLLAGFAGQLTTLPVANLSDATDAGRAMLTAVSAAAQRGLVNNPQIPAGRYGDHPSFNSEDGPAGSWAWVIKAILALQGAKLMQKPAAPTSGQVDDTNDTFSFLANPAYPSFAQYKVNGLPGVVGPVYLDATNSYVQGDRIYVRVVGAVAKGGLAVYVAGSGALPDGDVLTNADAFTGVVVTTPPTNSTPDAPFPSYDPVTRVLTFQHALGTSELEYNRFGGTFISYAPIQVDDSSHSAGEWKARIKAILGRNAGGTADSPAIIAKATVNQLPVVSAGDDLTITAPTSSVALLGTANDPDPTDTLTYQWRQITGPNSAIGMPATSLNVVVSNLAVGTYQFGFVATDQKGGKSTEDFVVVTVIAAPSGQKIKVLAIQRGDSRTRADGAAASAGFRTVNTFNAATPAQTAQGALANEGRQTTLEKAVDAFNAQFSDTHQMTALVLGYPSMTAFWYGRNHLATAYNGIDLTPYDVVIEISEWFANCAVYPDPTHQPTDSTAPAAIAAEVRRHMQVLKSKSSKVKSIVSLPPNRDNYSEFVNFKVARSQYCDLICADSSFDEIADCRTQTVGQDAAAANAIGDTFFDAAGHLSTSGTSQQSIPLVQAMARVLGQTLAAGNGTRTGTTAAATLAITPGTGTGTMARTATVTTAAAYASAKLYRISDRGLTYAPALVATDNAAPFDFAFTAAANGNYYVELTNASGALCYTYPNAGLAVSNPPITQQLDFMQHQVYFTEQPDGTLLKTGGPDSNHYAQASASRYVPPTPDNILATFKMPPLNNSGGDFLVGFGTNAVAVDGSVGDIISISKVSFYANDLTARVFLVIDNKSGQAGADFDRPAPGDQITIEKRADGYYFTNTTANKQYPTVLANGQLGGVPVDYLTTSHYVSAVASLTNSSVVPVVQLTSTASSPL